ncbi:MAG: hypothetical protein Q4C66_10425 [Lachnospiraceae bacterium]|nr:hypothetical protein [Lachnospiraceae bacterium]
MMSDISLEQILMIAAIAVLLFVLLPILEKRTGKNLTEIIFGVRRKSSRSSKKEEASGKKQEPKVSNGTRSELTSFVAQMLRFAAKNKMRLVAPGTVEYEGTEARLTCLLVAPGGIIGVYCLGFGGDIKPASSPYPWRQHINGQDLTFANPIQACQEQYQLVTAAMKQAGVEGSLKVVTVFTNPKANLQSFPSSVYTQQRFMDYLKENEALKQGTLDVEKTALALADLAKIKEKKESQKKKQREWKQKKSVKK